MASVTPTAVNTALLTSPMLLVPVFALGPTFTIAARSGAAGEYLSTIKNAFDFDPSSWSLVEGNDGEYVDFTYSTVTGLQGSAPWDTGLKAMMIMSNTLMTGAAENYLHYQVNISATWENHFTAGHLGDGTGQSVFGYGATTLFGPPKLGKTLSLAVLGNAAQTMYLQNRLMIASLETAEAKDEKLLAVMHGLLIELPGHAHIGVEKSEQYQLLGSGVAVGPLGNTTSLGWGSAGKWTRRSLNWYGVTDTQLAAIQAIDTALEGVAPFWFLADPQDNETWRFVRLLNLDWTEIAAGMYDASATLEGWQWR